MSHCDTVLMYSVAYEKSLLVLASSQCSWAAKCELEDRELDDITAAFVMCQLNPICLIPHQ